MVLLFNFDSIISMSTQAVCAVATLVGLSATTFTGLTANNRFWSVQSIYLIITFMFNLGLVAMVALGRNVVSPLEVLFTDWIYTPTGSKAALMAAMAILAGAIGSILTVRDRKPDPPEESSITREKVGLFAACLLCGSILLWGFYCVMRAGTPHIFFVSKGEFNDKTSGPVIDFFYWGILTGMGLLFSTRHPYVKFALFIFVLWFLDAFLLGIRGPALYPCAAAVIMAARRGMVRVGMTSVLIVMILGLGAISVVRDLRSFGAGHIAQSVGRANPADSLVELGGTLQATVMASQFVDKQGQMQHGATYFAPIDRVFLYYLIPGQKRVAAENDFRLANVLITKRIGPIGFSTIAEAYLNFGFWGTQGVLFLIGLWLGRLDSWDNSIPSLAFVLAFLHPLLDHIRQAFTPFPTYLALGLLTAFFVSRMVLNSRRQTQELSGRT